MAGLYFEADLYSQKYSKASIFRYKPIFQFFPDDKGFATKGQTGQSPYFPVFMCIGQDVIYFCMDELYAGYQVDLFRLPVSGLPSDNQRLVQALNEVHDPNKDISIDLDDHHLLKEYMGNDESKSISNRIFDHGIDKDNPHMHFSDLNVWGKSPISQHRLVDKRYYISRATLLLDFLYDLRFTDVFSDCRYYPTLLHATEKIFPLNALYFKAQYYYFQEERESARKAHRLRQLKNRARDLVRTREEYEAFLSMDRHWLNSPAEKVEPIEELFIESSRIFMSKKILFLAANPKDEQVLQLGLEQKKLDRTIRTATHRNRFHLIPRYAATISDMRQALVDYKPRILHFSGHGSKKYLEDTKRALAEESNTDERFRDRRKYQDWLKAWNGATLVFENDKREGIEINPEPFISLLSSFDFLECVYFNACSSGWLAKNLAHYIPVVIGNNTPILDEDAIKVANSFYANLGEGNSYEEAFQNCRYELKSDQEFSADISMWKREGKEPDEIRF